MGCNCDKNDDENMEELETEKRNPIISEKEAIHENLLLSSPIYKKNLMSIDPNGYPKDQFSKYLFDLINAVRQDPQLYIDIILKAKDNITIDKTGIKVYKSTVKVALNLGEPAFNSAIEVLKNTKPMDKLIYNPYLVIDLPTNENDIKSRGYLPGQIKLKINKGIEIKSFWKDIIKDPDTCFILTIVDDSGSQSGSKRKDILDETNKYIGISSVSIGKSFACYIVLS